jgi:hypothetical protein
MNSKNVRLAITCLRRPGYIIRHCQNSTNEGNIITTEMTRRHRRRTQLILRHTCMHQLRIAPYTGPDYNFIVSGAHLKST